MKVLIRILLLYLMCVSIIIVLFYLFMGRNDKGLVFAKTDIDLGEVDYNTEIEAAFPFKNFSDHTITIRKISSDCKCNETSVKKKEIMAGEDGVLDVKFTSSHRSGPEEHKIAVLTNSPIQKQIILSISAVISPDIELAPRVISFGRFSDYKNTSSREVSVISRFRGKAKINEIKTEQSYIQHTLIEQSPTHQREIGRIRLELCGEPPDGKFEGIINIQTQTEKGLKNNKLRIVGIYEGCSDVNKTY